MSVYICENGVTRECRGAFALGAMEALVKKFPNKYRWRLRSPEVSIMEAV